MSTYRMEWPCCGDATETNAWVPEECPFCSSDDAKQLSHWKAEAMRLMAENLKLEKQRDRLLAELKDANSLLAWHEEQIDGRYDALIAEIEAEK